MDLQFSTKIKIQQKIMQTELFLFLGFGDIFSFVIIDEQEKTWQKYIWSLFPKRLRDHTF